eukprot:scaffold43180_cov74-Cyclotella_meneghiniana.AAC.2
MATRSLSGHLVTRYCTKGPTPKTFSTVRRFLSVQQVLPPTLGGLVDSLFDRVATSVAGWGYITSQI